MYRKKQQQQIFLTGLNQSLQYSQGNEQQQKLEDQQDSQDSQDYEQITEHHIESDQNSKFLNATVDHCVYAFDTLLALMKKIETPNYPVEKFGYIECPLFVTWQLDGELRGCIGTLAEVPLAEKFTNYVYESAFNDPRFQPIQENELNKLEVTVSLLKNFEKVEDLETWDVGKHGIQIQFKDTEGDKYGGTYLPEVAQEQKWDQGETLFNLMRKAGFKYDFYERQIAEIEMMRYESSKFTLNYKDYILQNSQKQ